MNKQIYAALEINDSEVRLLVGEFFNTRFNVIKSEKVSFIGISNFEITDRNSLLSAIKNCINNASKAIGANVEAVVLVLPSVGFKRRNFKIDVKTETGVVNYSDARSTLENLYNFDFGHNDILVNIIFNKFMVNGISYRRLPVREIAKNFMVDLDVISINKKTAFDYVKLCEEAGLEILDICNDAYAVCKEASLLEKGLESNILIVKIENQSTSFGFINKGRLMQHEIIKDGLSDLIDAIYMKHQFDVREISKMIKYDYAHDSKEVSDDVVKMWNDGDLKLSLTQRQISDMVRPALAKMLNNIYETIKPIIDYGLDSIVVFGEGSKMQSLVDELEKLTGVNVTVYTPETIGARDTNLSACLGACYVYNDSLVFKDERRCSIDALAFENLMNKEVMDKDEESLTAKIKKIFNQRKKEER